MIQVKGKHGIGRQAGFSLIEMAIVLTILGFLLGGIVMPLAQQQSISKIRQTKQHFEHINDVLIGFAAANGRLPCPATPSSGGFEDLDPGGTRCASNRQHGFVPSATLGLTGTVNADNLLLDPWNNPIRYSVTDSDGDGDGVWDFTAANGDEMSNVGLADLNPDLQVCDGSPCVNTLSNDAAVVLISMGRNFAQTPSSHELENVSAGSTLTGGPSGRTYVVANNRVFVQRTYSDTPGSEFDDVVHWVNPFLLYNRLIAANQLP